MSSFKDWIGSDIVAFAYSAAERQGLTEIPQEMFNVPEGSTELGKISPATKRIALNLAAFAKLAEEKHQEAKAKGSKDHQAFHAIGDNVLRPTLAALNKLLTAQLIIDLGGDTLELLEKYDGLAIGEGEAIFGISKKAREPFPGMDMSILVFGRSPFSGMASDDDDD